MRHAFLHLLLVLFSTPSCTFAQSNAPVELGTFDGMRIAVSSGANNQRVSNAALVRVHNFNLEYKFAVSHTVLLACNGEWISTIIHSATSTPEQRWIAADAERSARAQEEVLPLDAVSITPIAESELFFAKPVARRAQAICKTAGREPKNYLIPVAEAKEDDVNAFSIALVLGTSSKVGSVVDIWTRSTWFKREDYKDKDGKLLVFNGVNQKVKEKTGKYSLDRRAFDCAKQLVGTFESATYETSKSTPESTSIPRDKLRMSSVIPGSVGEAQLEAVCALFQ